jgi:hypothetical protein
LGIGDWEYAQSARSIIQGPDRIGHQAHAVLLDQAAHCGMVLEGFLGRRLAFTTLAMGAGVQGFAFGLGLDELDPRLHRRWLNDSGAEHRRERQQYHGQHLELCASGVRSQRQSIPLCGQPRYTQ